MKLFTESSTLHVKMQKKTVISSLNKRSTKKMLNWCTSCFVTSVVLLDVFSSATSGTMFRRSSWVALARCTQHGALYCMNTKSPDLNRWESNKTEMGQDRWPNSIEGYVYFAVEKASSSSRKAGWGPILFSTASVKLLIMLLMILD